MATPLQPSRTSSRNEHKPLNPRRQMSRPSYTSRSSPPPRGSRRAGLLETIKDAVRPSAWVAFVKGTAHGLGVRYRHASRKQKALLYAFLALNLAIILAVIIITPRGIAQYMQDFADKIREMGVWGMILLFMMVVISSHPPFFGFTFSLTMIGYTFGLWPGALLAIAASMTGAGVAFLSVRTFFLQWMKQFGSGKSDKWEAFSHVVKAKGTILIIMIRWCPFPWALGNGLFASIDSVSFPSFMLANLLLQPRLLVPVFIGSRLVSLVDDGGDKPADPVAKWINAASIIVGLSVSLGTGWFIYRATLQQMRDLGYEGVVSPEEAEEARDFLEENALLGDYSGDDYEDEHEGGSGTPLRGLKIGGDLERQEDEHGVTKGFTSTSGMRSGRM
ncbi:hypothetical protein QFC20_003330 [Naganishia adeliensis]|uniref:Uncharacterized protein n=1 Tax=Naganishia adeliensis TaxID=92952 RepID=A0ACC2WDV1_9TREE|nr:hypothetical protein QFC20_003330 [Naganishia adeliensis]